MEPTEVGLLVHGTTIGINAIIQRRGARGALLVSKGYREVPEIDRGRIPASFDFHADKEAPLVPSDRMVEISTRLAARGTPSGKPDNATVARAAAFPALAPDAVAQMLLNGYAHPDQADFTTYPYAALLRLPPFWR